jgi:hypothetical protein
VSFANRTRAGAVVALAAVASMALGAGGAQAATYPSGGSTFSGGPEGWKVAGTPSCNIGVLGTIGVCKGSGGYDEGNGNPPGSLKAETEVTVNLGGPLQSQRRLRIAELQGQRRGQRDAAARTRADLCQPAQPDPLRHLQGHPHRQDGGDQCRSPLRHGQQHRNVVQRQDRCRDARRRRQLLGGDRHRNDLLGR